MFEGKYIKGERNGKGKEYHNNELIFEGEYLNNKRWNGKGKEYDNYRLIYEGENANRERNWKGKEYHNNGNILFDGEYKKGKWNGIWKEYYYKNGKLKYDDSLNKQYKDR